MIAGYVVPWTVYTLPQAFTSHITPPYICLTAGFQVNLGYSRFSFSFLLPVVLEEDLLVALVVMSFQSVSQQCQSTEETESTDAWQCTPQTSLIPTTIIQHQYPRHTSHLYHFSSEKKRKICQRKIRKFAVWNWLPAPHRPILHQAGHRRTWTWANNYGHILYL